MDFDYNVQRRYESYINSSIIFESMTKMVKILFPMLLFSLLIILGSGQITAPVDIIVFKGSTSIINASVWVDGQYRGVTDIGGHLYIQDLDLGFHTVNA